MPAKTRIAVVGAGAAATLIHLPILSLLSDMFEICAVCDPDIGRAEIAAQRHNIPHFFVSLEEMLESVDIDSVAVLSPEHTRAIDRAISSNLNVFTEKPISLRCDYSLSLAERALRQNLVFEVGLMRVYDMAIRHLYSEVPSDVVKTAHFHKCDGSDAVLRELLLPAGMTPYQLKVGADGERNILSGNQLRTAQLLLWNGIHLLGAIVFGFGSVEAKSSYLAPSGDSLVCVFQGQIGQTIILDVAETRVPVYDERIHLFSPELLGVLELSSPYIAPTISRVTVSSKDDYSCRHSVREFTQHIFRSMWEQFHQSVVSTKAGNSSTSNTLDLGLKVEALALEAARLVA